MQLRLIDKDDDLIECNGSSEWDNFEDCKKDLEYAFLNGNLTDNYLPFRFIDVDSTDDDDEYIVYQIIKKVNVTFETTPLRVVPYKHRNQS